MRDDGIDYFNSTGKVVNAPSKTSLVKGNGDVDQFQLQ
jgi:hypothetical protein